MTRDLRRLHRAAWLVIAPAVVLILALAIAAHKRSVRVLDAGISTSEARR